MAERHPCYPDKGWGPNGIYYCLGFGCGWHGWPWAGTACRVCGTVVPERELTQARWRREVLDAGLYRPTLAAAR